MDNIKLGNFEAISLILIIIINHIILNFSKTIISATGSASALNILFIGIILLLFIELVIFLFKRFTRLDILDISSYLGGRILKTITGILFIGYYIVFASILLRTFCENLKIIYLDKLPITIIVIIFLIAITYANKLGFKVISKVNMLFLPIILFCMIFVFIANIKNYNLSGLFPLLGYGPKPTFLLGLSNLFAFSSISILYFLPPMVNDNSFKKIGRVSTILSILLFFIGIFSFLCLFSFLRNSEEIMALYLATRYIEFGRFFQRLDAVFLMIWTIGVISYLCIITALSIHIFKKITNIKNSRALIYCFSGIIYVITLIPKNIAQANYIEINIFKYVVFFLLFGYSLFVLIFANIKKISSQNVQISSKTQKHRKT